MQHLHRLKIRINVPRRAPLNIQIDAQDVLPPDPAALAPRRSPRDASDGIVMPR